MGRRVGGVGIGRLRLLLRLGVEKMVMAEKKIFYVWDVTKLEGKL